MMAAPRRALFEGEGVRTRVGASCEGIIEAGWLIALVGAPLFFNPSSYRVFEADRSSLLRSIATLMVVVGAIRWIEGRFATGSRGVSRSDNSAGGSLRILLVAPALLLAVAYAVSTVTSVVPRVSLWGSYHRLQGTYTTFSYLAIFFLMLRSLRRQEQMARLVSGVILASLPVALYGLLQRYGLDPLSWSGQVSERVLSTLGNPVFLGAYLEMVVSLTLGRVLELQGEALRGIRPSCPRRRSWSLSPGDRQAQRELSELHQRLGSAGQ